jgi:hypothetical protein
MGMNVPEGSTLRGGQAAIGPIVLEEHRHVGIDPRSYKHVLPPQHLFLIPAEDDRTPVIAGRREEEEGSGTPHLLPLDDKVVQGGWAAKPASVRWTTTEELSDRGEEGEAIIYPDNSPTVGKMKKVEMRAKKRARETKKRRAYLRAVRMADPLPEVRNIFLFRSHR